MQSSSSNSFSALSTPIRSTPSRNSGVWPFVLGSMVLGTVGVFVHEAGASPLTAVWFRSLFGLLGLVWGLLLQDRAICLFFLGCVVVAGVFGAATVKRSILFVQAVPAIPAAIAAHYF